MNSWSNHIPKAAGALGALLLAYSMYTFFHRPEIVVPVAKPHTPPRAETPPVPAKATEKYVPKTWDKNAVPATNADGERQAAEKAAAEREAKERLEAQMRVPREYLAGVDLKMFIPEEMAFAETRNEQMKILMGMRNGQPELFVASGKQKMTPEQARGELEDQMAAYGVKVSKQDTAQSAALGATTTFRGSTANGGDFRAQYFYNAASGQSYMVMMMGKERDKQPARTRQIFDSLEYQR